MKEKKLEGRGIGFVGGGVLLEIRIKGHHEF